MSFEIGQKVGPYEVVDYFDNLRIGAGYMVKNTALDRVEILRLLPKDPHHDRESVDRFLREIIVHSRLAHPHIVAFYSALDIDGNLVMTTEYVPGVTLARRIEQGAIGTAEAVAWAGQILSALAYAHDNGVVHREVSPANIVITESGEAKLGGFGLAKGLNDPELTRVGTVMGWIEYMSPEQVQGLPRVDARSDIYSAGAVLYEMITGRVPFQASSQFEVMLAHVRETPRPPAELNPQVPADLSLVILQALEKDPEKRFETAQAFRSALEKTSVRAVATAVAESRPEAAPEAAAIAERVASPAADAALAVSVLAPAALASASATVEPAQAAVEPRAAVEPAHVAVEPAHAAVASALAGVEPAPAAVKSAPAAVQSEPAAVQSEPAAVDSAPAAVESTPSTVEPAPAMAEPSSPAAEPAHAAIQPKAWTAEPASWAVEPMRSAVEPAVAEITPADSERPPAFASQALDRPAEPSPATTPEPETAPAPPPAAEAQPAVEEPKPAAASAFTWRPKSEEEIEEQQKALENAPPEIPAAEPPPLAWSRHEPYVIPEIPEIPETQRVPELPPQQLPSLEALLAEDPLSVAASRGYVRPPNAAADAAPSEPLPTWKLVVVGTGAFVLVGLTMYAILRSFGG